jgi:hypothetical protein
MSLTTGVYERTGSDRLKRAPGLLPEPVAPASERAQVLALRALRRNPYLPRVLEPGYPFAIFGYDRRRFSGLDAAQEHLFADVERAADVYYEVVGGEHRLSDEWDDLMAVRTRLLEIEGRRGPRSFLRRHWSEPMLLRELAVGLTNVEATAAQLRANYVEARRDLEAMVSTPFLFDEIDERIRSGFEFPAPSITRPIELFERRRLASAQNHAALLSAVLAAVIGTVAALWVASNDDGNRTHTVTVRTSELPQPKVEPLPASTTP